MIRRVLRVLSDAADVAPPSLLVVVGLLIIAANLVGALWH